MYLFLIGYVSHLLASSYIKHRCIRFYEDDSFSVWDTSDLAGLCLIASVILNWLFVLTVFVITSQLFSLKEFLIVYPIASLLGLCSKRNTRTLLKKLWVDWKEGV